MTMGAVKSTRRKSAPPARQGRVSEPTGPYGVLTLADEDGVVWHYPVRNIPRALLNGRVGASHAGDAYTSVMFLAAKGARHGTPPVRFRSRSRAVRFVIEEAEAEREPAAPAGEWGRLLSGLHDDTHR